MKLGDLWDGQITHGAQTDVRGLTADSREVKPSFVFAALPGTKIDGARFIPEAIKSGAVAIIGLPGTPASGLPLIASDDPRRALAVVAARFYPAQPKTMVAVTGTNGKSSTVEFLRQIWAHAGYNAAAVGTLGITMPGGHEALHHTTPDPVRLHAVLDGLAGRGITHAAMEASSHGLVQRRLDGVRLTATGFTNLSQDHFDYHTDFNDYFQAKSRLFDTLAPTGSKTAIMVDDEWGAQLAKACAARGMDVVRLGWAGEEYRLEEIIPKARSQVLKLSIFGKREMIEVPLAGEFQVSNALLALALAVQTGVDVQTGIAALKKLYGVRGRLEYVGQRANGAPVFIDFAHTPDGLDKLLRALRPHTSGRIHLVFGCGGDRDPLKRPKMGAVAAALADKVIISDDNPRHENPDAIRAAILAACPDAQDIADRKTAIETAIAALAPDDALVIAGKGHETGQIVGDTVIPFNDAQVARAVLDTSEGHDEQ